MKETSPQPSPEGEGAAAGVSCVRDSWCAMSERLKPCPWCGQDVATKRIEPMNKTAVLVYCPTPGCVIAHKYMDRDKWNERVIEDGLRARIEELEKLRECPNCRYAGVHEGAACRGCFERSNWRGR